MSPSSQAGTYSAPWISQENQLPMAQLPESSMGTATLEAKHKESKHLPAACYLPF